MSDSIDSFQLDEKLDRPPPLIARGRSTGSGYGLPVGFILMIALLDGALDLRTGLAFTGWALPLSAITFLLSIGVVYTTVRKRPELAELVIYTALWVGFCLFGAILTYHVIALSGPLRDADLARFDRNLGFDWPEWIQGLKAHPFVQVVMAATYGSLIFQIIGSLLVLALARKRGRNRELLVNMQVALCLTSVLVALMPAAGPWTYFSSAGHVKYSYIDSFMALRNGHNPPFILNRMEGVYTFPSFHAVMAFLFTYSQRGIRGFFPVFAVVNGIMLFSIPSEGGHYLCDIVSGATVAVLTLCLTGRVFRTGETSGSDAPPKP
ncbi:phosphatase PAP2 family protein [Gluconacetobacter diazotrophicus]|nr:phosphatase PAP2 family protein [Gluconacetobacter diazotrophicus]